jgi:hypothetical protein
VGEIELRHEVGIRQELERVPLDELLPEVARLGLDVAADHVRTGQLVATGRPAGSTKGVEPSRPRPVLLLGHAETFRNGVK